MKLLGMTWDHPRAYEPMLATSRAYAAAHPGVEIAWEKRSLQAFADHPVEELAARYDLVIIDHPHVGSVSRSGCLVALDGVGREKELKILASQSLGQSHESYQFDGHQWALAIDAAAQVAAYRKDLLPSPPTTWDAVINLAQQGKVLWPIKPVDSLMSFFTLAANRGTPCGATPGRLIDSRDGAAVLEAMAALARHVPRECLTMNPIQTLDRMSASDEFWYCPHLYCYSNYARDGFRERVVHFSDIPAFGDQGPRGSTLGGTGIAVSSRGKNISAAVDFAFWVCSADVQRGLYFDAGGQPANADAWEDDRANAASHNFFRDIRRTMDLSWIRPRHAGYLDFQDRGGDIVNAFLAGRGNVETTLRDLETVYRESLT